MWMLGLSCSLTWLRMQVHGSLAVSRRLHDVHWCRIHVPLMYHWCTMTWSLTPGYCRCAEPHRAFGWNGVGSRIQAVDSLGKSAKYSNCMRHKEWQKATESRNTSEISCCSSFKRALPQLWNLWLRTPTPHHRRRHPGLRRAEPFQKTFCNVLRCSVFRYASMVCDAPCRRRFENFMSICDDFVLAWVFVKSYKYSLYIIYNHIYIYTVTLHTLQQGQNLEPCSNHSKFSALLCCQPDQVHIPRNPQPGLRKTCPTGSWVLDYTTDFSLCFSLDTTLDISTL